MYTCVYYSTQDGFTPLMVAVHFNRSDVVKLLLQGGANCILQAKVIFTAHVHVHMYRKLENFHTETICIVNIHNV